MKICLVIACSIAISLVECGDEGSLKDAEADPIWTNCGNLCTVCMYMYDLNVWS